jgi:hypothetical protein
MKRTISMLIVLLASAALAASAQATAKPAITADALTETGQIETNGHLSSYVIHYLPASSFPGLPATIANAIAAEGCLIPQTYEAHRPENVVHASLERAGSDDWALLCSHKGTVALMVFFASSPDHPIVLASAPETERVQRHNSSQSLGFNWGIDPASPERVHAAQIGLSHRPAAPDHDALADSIIDHKAVYHFYSKGKWTLIDLPE